MSKANMLSNLGRMNYGLHLAFYPTAALLFFGLIKPYRKAAALRAVQEEFDTALDGRKVNPDIFNPFTPIPYHNNPEQKYALAHINMIDYVNEKHINVRDYSYKQYHDVYDHDNKNSYLYNWTSYHGRPEH